MTAGPPEGAACGGGIGPCEEGRLRYYLIGWCCPAHTPARHAGHPEPGKPKPPIVKEKPDDT